MKLFRLFSILFLLGCWQSIYSQDKLYHDEFPLGDVTLLDGPFKHARDLNIKVLLEYNTDRMLAPYRKEAGLPAKAESYPNWIGLDGHVGGHYLSALAINYAATGNLECKKRMDYMISELKACQQAMGSKYPDWGVGYVGGVPDSKGLWPTIKAGETSIIWKYWVPWYNVHKMYAGLRDAWLYAGNEEAKDIFLRFCDWAINVTASLSDKQMESMLASEHGGMNEVFADAYQITGIGKYEVAAKRFSHKMLLDAMAASNDNLDNKHANTQVPKAVGFERIAELDHDEKYGKAGSFFWETVTGHRSLAFGGNSRREFFPSVSACIDYVNDVEGPETCNSYNMLKLTEDLFRVQPLGKYADFYERTLFNHILSSQHPEHGGYVYFTPARPRHYRVYSAPNEGMWCCVGSGMENHGKYGQFIYTHSHDSLYLNLFIASELNWRKKAIKIRQETNFPNEEQTKLTVTEGRGKFKLLVRYPSWVNEGALKVFINGKIFKYLVTPSSYICIDRAWKKGDAVKIELPMHNSIERMPNVPQYIAFMRGPILLAAKTGTQNLKGLVAGDSRWGHIAGGEKLSLNQAPIILEDNLAELSKKLVPVAGKPMNFKLSGVRMVNPVDVVLEPFADIHDARYMMYWMALSEKQYKVYVDSLSIIEQQKIEMEKRTVDFVAPGEQQPEVDHGAEKQNSNTGSYLDEFWRDARNGGYFSYQLGTNGENQLHLMVRYWGAEGGNRAFDIYVDDQKLVSENISGKWGKQAFQNVEYAIPGSMLEGKKSIRVKFQALPGNIAGSVYYVRLLRPTDKK
ncbi:MAG: hypothetical protein H6Q14_1953 [Bacteroidetes bacterium]|nr:hypothetical protein [Bacteroidota bacterium]